MGKKDKDPPKKHAPTKAFASRVCPFCKNSGQRRVWDIDPKTDKYGWIKVNCDCGN